MNEKLKLIIVDDELTSRNLIKSLICDSTQYEVVADFADARLAIDWLRENEIDILLCDMQMPYMNGVEFIQLARSIYEFLPVIAISGFDDYNYTRGCMINGVADYLLKSELTKKKLLQTLNLVQEKYKLTPEDTKVKHKIGYCIEMENQFNETNIHRLIINNEIEFDESYILPIAISPDFRKVDKINYEEYRKDIEKAIKDIITQILNAEYKYIFYSGKNLPLILLLSFKDVRSMLYIYSVSSNFADKLRRRTIRMLDTTLTIAMGTIQINLAQAINQSQKLITMTGEKLYNGGNKIMNSDVVELTQYQEGCIPDLYWKQVSYEVKNLDSLGAKSVIRDIFNKCKEQKVRYEDVVRIAINLLEILTTKELISVEEENKYRNDIQQIEIVNELEDFLIIICDFCFHKAEKKSNLEISTNIIKAKEYIRLNYTKDISLESCANDVGTSYTHLSREFKKETGMGFVEYLNLLRINKAKSLLIRNDISMKEIVESVGFRNYNYFFKVFKNVEGVTPNEFLAKK